MTLSHSHPLILKLWAFQEPPVTGHRSQHSPVLWQQIFKDKEGRNASENRRWEKTSTSICKDLLEVFPPVTLFLPSPTKSSSRKFCFYLFVIVRWPVNAPYLNSIKRRQKALGCSRSKPLLLGALIVHCTNRLGGQWACAQVTKIRSLCTRFPFLTLWEKFSPGSPFLSEAAGL